MLSPEARTVAIDLLRPPPGHRLDLALLTTFSLDLEMLLALPLAVLAQADGGIEELLADPLTLLEALREAGTRIHVFVDAAGIGTPRIPRPLYAMLEHSVHPVSAPNGGAFHPKVWVARFAAADAALLIRVAVLSRNLTDDRSWDLSLVSEGTPAARRTYADARALKDLFRRLPGRAKPPLPEPAVAQILEMADALERTRFPAPEGFDDHIRYHCLGLGPVADRHWQPVADGQRMLAMAPFANAGALKALRDEVGGQCTLISRQETLDAIPEEVLAPWQECLVLSEAAAEETADSPVRRPSGLHAKAICIESGFDATWLVGSANLSSAALRGRNVEVMAEITGKKGREGSGRGCGIDRFRESGILALCTGYRRGEQAAVNTELAAAKGRLEQARDALVHADLALVCTPGEETWGWTLDGELDLPGEIRGRAWPITLDEAQASLPLSLPQTRQLPTTRLTAFVAFELRSEILPDEPIRLVRKLSAEGLPEGRINQILRALIDSPERLLRFLRALLGGLEGLIDWGGDQGKGRADGAWGQGLDGDTLLEDLVRAASRDPARLEPVRRLIDDLRQTEDGCRIVPDDLYAIWQAVDQSIGERKGQGPRKELLVRK